MLNERQKQLCVVIPAYNPLPQMVQAVQMLSQSESVAQLIVVDDGSGPETQPLFDIIENLPKATLLRHAINLGKGQALKTAFNHVLVYYPGVAGVVTADADGQHLPGDIGHVVDELLTEPGQLVLGVRSFTGTVPLRCWLGNRLTAYLVRLLTCPRISDTQTGLRGIPMSLLPMLLQLRSARYEFEMEMLLVAVRHNISIREVPIQTVYLENNRHSRFHPLLDSVAIYRVLFRQLLKQMFRRTRAA